MTPDEDKYHILLTETSYSEHKPENKDDIVDRVVQGLINTKLLTNSDIPRIESTYLIDVDYSYPVPTVDRNDALATIQPYLMEQGIYSRGRFGAWEYEIGNMDHSVMQGVELVNHWLLGEPEVTWKDFSSITKAKSTIDLNVAAATNGSGIKSISGHGLVQAGVRPLNMKADKSTSRALDAAV